MKTTTINGTFYKFKKFEPLHNGVTSIYELYNRPSQAKVKAFNYWKERLDLIYWMYGNSCNFSIYGMVKDEKGIEHDVYITKWNSYISN